MKFPMLGIMFLIFMTLKLTGTIAWSWWWVTAPLWGGIALVATIYAVVLGFAGLCYLIDLFVNKKR